MFGRTAAFGADHVTNRESSHMQRTLKITCFLAIIAMSFLSIEVIVGLTSFYVGGVAKARLMAFVVVAIFPIIAAVLYAMLNCRNERPGRSFSLMVGLLVCDLVLLSFANGHI